MARFLLILLVFFIVSCKQEPSYQLKEPFGNTTASALDEVENDPADFIKIPKKFLDKAKLKERDRKNRHIQKQLKEAQEFDPTL